MNIVLEGERCPSWNKFYSGMHWKKRASLANSIHEKVFYAIKQQHPHATIFNTPVIITVIAYFKNRPLDCCNITAKLYIDGLIGHVIEDDSPKYVKRVVIESRVDKENPRLEITITRR